ncbi:hypothetical protein [Sandaracinus amylolyticus]|nr:hypothetical protein [Sandaracinus amylolyticus]
MKRIALATVCLATMLLASGCKVVVTGSSTYETCVTDGDCNDAFDRCVSVTNGSATDAQCTSTCDFDSDCPGSGHCVSFDGVNSFCYQTCVTDAICESGWSCNDLSDGSAVCLPGGTAPVGEPTYDACSSTSQCADGNDQCVPITNGSDTGSQCTRECADDLDCPGSGHCVSFDGSNFFCYELCTTNASCESNWGCTDLSDGSAVCLPGDGTPPPPPGIPPYNECPFGANPDQCSEVSQGCFQIAVDGTTAAGVCTSECTSSAQCPVTPSGLQGTCVEYFGSPRICFESCIDDNDCLEGFNCKPIAAGESQRICLPTP